jgi:hypothetical protein
MSDEQNERVWKQSIKPRVESTVSTCYIRGIQIVDYTLNTVPEVSQLVSIAAPMFCSAISYLPSI